MAVNTKNYIISLNARVKGSKAVLTGLSNIEGKTKKFKQTVQVAGKSMQTFESRIGGIAKRALMTVPVWLALRTVMMGVITTVRTIITTNLDLEDGMARIRTVMHGTSGEIKTGMIAAKGAILDMAMKTKVPIKELAETFYFLKTASLSMTEAMAAFEPTVNAMVGTGAKGKEMARSIAGMYNTMGKSMSNAMTEAQKFTRIADILTYTYSCYTPDTEVLTDQGWKLFTELDKTEKMITINPETKKIEYQKPTNYVNEPFEGNLCHIKGRFVDIMVTPTHKLYAQMGYSPVNKDYKLIEAREAFGRPKRFYRGGNWIGENQDYFALPKIDNITYPTSDMKIPIKTWIEFLAWYLAEGTHIYKTKAGTPHYRTIIYQSEKSKHYEKLKDVMSKMPFKFYENKPINHVNSFIISNKQLCFYLKQFGLSKDKFLPDIIKNLPKDLLRLFLKTYTYGDGHQHNRGNGFTIITASQKMKDDIQEIALKADYGCTVNFQKGTEKIINNVETKSIGVWHLGINERTEFLIYHKKNQYYAKKENRKTQSIEKWVPYKGRVVCVEIPNHILFVRRNGKSFWCGNTQDVQMDELIAGYAKLAPFTIGLSDSLLTLVTIIGFLNTKMLRSGRTGRLLARAIVQITKNSKQLAEIFKITLDPNQPIPFLNVLKKMSAAWKDQTKATSAQLDALRKVFAMRALTPTALMLADMDELIETLDRAAKHAGGFAEAMAEIRMGTTTARAAQLKNALLVLINEFITGVARGGTLAGALKNMTEAVNKQRGAVKKAGQEWGYFFETWERFDLIAKAMPKTEGFIKSLLPTTAIKGLKNFINIMKTVPVGALIPKTYEEYIKGIESKAKAELAHEKNIEELASKKEASEKQRVITLKEQQAITKHNVNLMKIMKVSALDIARYRLEALEVEKSSMIPKEQALELEKRRAKVYEEQLRFKQTLVNTLQKAEIGMLQALGASELQILQYKERQIIANQTLIGTTQSLISLAKIRQQTAIAITNAKEKEQLTVSNIYMEYEKADKFEKAKLNRFIEIRKMSAEEIGETYEMGGFDASVIEEKWSRLAEFQKKAIGKILAEQQGRIITGLTDAQLANIERVAPALREAMGETWEGMMPPEAPKIPEGWKSELTHNVPKLFMDNMLSRGKVFIEEFKKEFGMVGDLGTPPGLYRPPTEGSAPGVPTAVSVPISIESITINTKEKIEEGIDEALKELKERILGDKEYLKNISKKM